MKRLIHVLIFFGALNVSGQGIFDGFKVMKLPRQVLPLGAEWINGVGVNGTGVPESNITVSKSVNSLEISNSFKQELDLSILSYLNLDESQLKNTSINYNQIIIYTIRDFSLTDLHSGQLILYECIKADSIFFKINKLIDASVKAKLDERLKDLKVNSSTNYQKGIFFSGEDLYLAYRVFQLGKTNVLKKTSRIKDTPDGGGLREVKLMDYQIIFNDNNLHSCLFPDPQKIEYNKERWLNCEKTTPIEVSIYNFKITNINGKPMRKDYEVLNNTYSEFYLSQRKDNKLITDYIKISYIIDDPDPLYNLYMNKKSEVVINRMETSLTMFKNPYAPGW